jgi:hypothetical protein
MHKAEVYTFQKRGEWAILVLDEVTGAFFCHGSYGSYSHVWSYRGEGVSLKEFVRDLDFDYFMKKTRSEYRRFDEEATVNNVKDYICRIRRDDGITSDIAREAWKDIEAIADELYNYKSADLFVDRMYASHPLCRILNPPYEFVRESPDPDSIGFWNQIWPELLTMIAPSPPPSDG